MKKQRLIHLDHHMLCVEGITVEESANINAQNVVSHILKKTVMYCTRAKLHRVGEHQTKGELEEIEKEIEVEGMTGAKPEVWREEVREVMIDVGNHPNMIRETNPLDPLETESSK